MKQSAMIAIVLICSIGGYYTYKTKTNVLTVVNNEPTVVEKTVEVETLANRIKSAQNAELEQIEASAQKAYDEKKEQLLTEIELETTRAYRKEIETRESELEKKVSL